MVKHSGSLRALLISTILGGFPAMPALANPTGAQVVAGGVKVRGEGTKTVVVAQSTDRAIINWRNFDIAADETTRFVQPRNESITLNRITSGQPTRILGNLQANGNVFVINGNGVVFGKGSQVNVGGLVASTADIDDRSFLRSTGQYRFDRAGDPNAEIVVDGSINVQRAGVAAFVAPRFSNSGMVRATLGRIAIGAADRFTLDMAGDGLIRFAPSDGFGRSSGGIAVENSGVLEAQSGLIEISAFAARDAINGSVRVDGMVSAGGATRNPDGSVQLSGTGGRIDIAATGAVELGKASTLDASGADGGTVRINTPGIAFLDGKITADGGNAGGAIAVSANNIASTGTLSATGGTGAGGAIAVIADNRYIATTASDIDASGAQGGSITVAGGLGTGQGLFSSGTMLANGSSQAGGAIAIHGHEINLVAATGSADGHSGGGQISVGHVRGADDKVAIGAATVELSPDTVLSASALGKGDGGRIVVWSIDLTRAWGATNARGGPVGGDGGFIELSSRGALVFGGSGDASAPLGARGTLLLDPRNLTIDDAEARFPQYQLIDPNPNAGNNFGGNVLALYTGNVVVTSVSDDFGGINAGAAYLYNLTTGGLISTLVGSSVMDSVGSAGIAVLANGNYVVRSGIWDNGSIVDASAMTFGNGVTGVSGTVSASNSLVGSTTGDNLSQNGIVTLANGNYLVRSSRWDNGSAVNAGAVTFGNGVTGTVGVVSAANSLIGSSAEDFVGAGEVIALTNGNYVVTSHSWNNGSIGDAGAVTFGDGTTGTLGTVSAANSLIGTAANDRVGSGGVVALTNGNYVVTSYLWDNGSIVDAGAVTWVNGATGLIGSISASNSLVGTTANVQVGSTGVTALTNGNYVVTSSNWGNGLVANLGAITWGNGATGIAGAVSVNNSLVGTTANDSLGAAGLTKLTNGNYVVASSTWDNGSVLNAGAVTWGNGTTGTVGTVSASNSLVGTTAGDSVGATGVTALTNGNYVVASSLWDNGSIGNAGAVTWGDGTTGITGAVSASNSLVGSTASDNVGSARLTALTNGNYVVISPVWDKGSIANAGAVTWGNGAAGTVGAVSVSNSLVGSTAGDNVGSSGVTALANGNYVVASHNWDNVSIVNAGAVTFGNGTTGVVGAVSGGNSLIGTSSNDLVGINSVLALTNGNYIVRSSNWDRGSAVNAGAVTFGNGVTGVIGPVSISNSLVGSTAGDAVGGGAIIVPDGNYVVFTSSWDNNSIINAGAVTFGDGATGTVGNISAMNSLIGSIRDSSPGYVPTAESGFILARSVTDGGSGRVYVGLTDPNLLTYARAQGQDITISSAAVRRVLDTGTALTLQANNDITVNSAIAVDNPSGNGGAFTLAAGRSIFINAAITSDNGNVGLFANDLLAHDVVDDQRAAGDAVIAFAHGGSIDAGTGTIDIQLRDGAGKTNFGSGGITFGSSGFLTASAISVVNSSATATGGITIGTDFTLNASGPGDALVLAGRSFTNNAGSTALHLTDSAGRFLVYSSDWDNDLRGGLIGGNLYNRSYTDTPPSSVTQAGSQFIFTRQPLLTVQVDGATREYGLANPTFTGSFVGGLVNGDTLAQAMSGMLGFSTTATQASDVGSYAIDVNLLSDIGYGVARSVNSGTLSITQALLSVTADDAARAYGLPNPRFTGRVSGFRNGDTASVISGLIYASTATAASDAGSYAITASGASATNYRFAYTPGWLTIDAAPSTAGTLPDFAKRGVAVTQRDQSTAGETILLTNDHDEDAKGDSLMMCVPETGANAGPCL